MFVGQYDEFRNVTDDNEGGAAPGSGPQQPTKEQYEEVEHDMNMSTLKGDDFQQTTRSEGSVVKSIEYI